MGNQWLILLAACFVAEVASKDACPEGWKTAWDSCYLKLEISPKTFALAKEACKEKDERAGLPYFANKEEYMGFAKYAEELYPHIEGKTKIRIGLDDTEKDGKFEIEVAPGKRCRAPLLDWEVTNPSGDGYCTEYMVQDGKMNDLACDSLRDTVCQIRLKPYSCRV